MTKTTGVPETINRPRLFAYSLGFLFQRRVRMILNAHGWQLKLGLPRGGADAVGVWGHTKVARRGRAVARNCKTPLVTIEDAFLRSVLTGRQGAQPLGLVMDHTGIYFDTSKPCDLDALFIQSLNLTRAELDHAASLMAHLGRLNLSKYNDFSPNEPDLPDDFSLVIDQTLDDAAITMGGATAASFAEMLACAKAENPNRKILVKTHPETAAGKRQGYFSEADCDEQVAVLPAQISPKSLFERAVKIYCVTSQMGLEAIFAGHRPVVFGHPFYAGLGLTDDRGAVPDKGISLTPAQVFWATHLHYSKWYDPYFDRATDFETTTLTLHAQARQHQDNKARSICVGMRLWKRGFLRTFLSGQSGAPRFLDDIRKAVEVACIQGGRVLVWAGKETDELVQECSQKDVPLIRVEDGFLRSVGLGAKLVAPVSLAFDGTGIYYDPTRPSHLETIINAGDTLTEMELARARAVQARIVALNMTKYNLAANTTALSPHKGWEIILVPGQVEDDASILKGACDVKTNLDLLQAARRDFPNAYIVYKPHPDVEAGLRVGAIEAMEHADLVVSDSNMADLLKQADRVATITSLAGFEALLRGKAVTCYGQPFYSGWGLTDDRAGSINRRQARPSLDALIHACLIEYPRYWDPVSQEPCPIEVVLERFERGQMAGKSGVFIRLLAKAQGLFASYAHLWR